MNYIIFNKLSDFNKVIDAEIVFTSNIDEEIEENWWSIKLKPSLAQKISISNLRSYIDNLLKKKKEQVAEYSVPATFYMWVDEQSFQLQLNILSGHTVQLPFRCKVNLVKNIDPLLEKIIEVSKKGALPLDDIIFDDEMSDEEDGPENYTLDVFLELM